jgi:hypothetical protein
MPLEDQRWEGKKGLNRSTKEAVLNSPVDCLNMGEESRIMYKFLLWVKEKFRWKRSWRLGGVK